VLLRAAREPWTCASKLDECMPGFVRSPVLGGHGRRPRGGAALDRFLLSSSVTVRFLRGS
jgi:hypothetical protein